MANEENYFETDLSDIGMTSNGEDDSIDLDAVLSEQGEASEGEASEEDTSKGDEESQEDDGLLDIEKILSQEGANDDEDNEGSGGTRRTPDEDNSGTPNNDTSSSQDNEGVSPLTPFASLLHEQGVLPHLNLDEISKLEDSEKVVEALIGGVQEEINKANEAFINSLPAEFHDMVEAYKEGVPFDLLANNKRTQLAYDSITDDKLEEDVDLQKKLITDLMIAKGLKESRVKKLIERSEDLGELFEDAKEAKEEIVEAQKGYAKQLAAQEKENRKTQEAAYKKSLDDLKTSIDSAEEIIPGIKVNKTIKEGTYKNMTEPVAYDDNGNPVNFIMHKRAESKNPTLFDIRLNYLVEVTNGFTDFSKLNATAETSASKKFLKSLDSNTGHKGGSPKKPGTKNDSDYMKKLLGSI